MHLVYVGTGYLKLGRENLAVPHLLETATSLPLSLISPANKIKTSSAASQARSSSALPSIPNSATSSAHRNFRFLLSALQSPLHQGRLCRAPNVKPSLPIDDLDIVPFFTQFGEGYAQENVCLEHLREVKYAMEHTTIVPPIFIVAFTGHRPKAGAPGRSPEELEATRPLIQRALTLFIDEASKVEGVIHLHSSAAEGADLIACEVAQSFQPPIPVHLILPLPEYEFKNDFIDSQSGELSTAWTRAKALIDSCRAGTHGNTLRITHSTHERPSSAPVEGPDCYADANFQMLSNADALIAVKIDDPSATAGGSGLFWDDAAARSLPRIQINPATQTTSPPADLDNLISPENEENGIQLFNGLYHHLARHGPVPEQADLPEALALFDKAADSFAKKSRANLRATISLHGSASFLAAIGLAYALAHGPNYPLVLFILVFIEVFLIGYAEFLHRLAHKSHTGKAWLDCRFAAESLRMLTITSKLTDPLDYIIAQHRPAWRRFLCSFNLLSQQATVELPLKEAKAFYLNERIEDQIAYFKKQSARAAPKSTRAHKWVRFTSLAALVIVIVACISKGFALSAHSSYHHFQIIPFLKDFLLYLLPVALPLLAGILLALRHSFDLGRRQHRYQHLVQLLEASKTNLSAAHTPYAFQQVITQVEETLLDERIEFDIAQRVGLEH